MKKLTNVNLMGKKYKNVFTALNYVEHLLILASVFTRCVEISAFASLFGIPKGIPSPAVGLNICATITGIKTYKSIIKEKEKKHNKKVLLAKTKLNRI